MFAFIFIVLAVILFQLYSNQVNYTLIFANELIKKLIFIDKNIFTLNLNILSYFKKPYCVKKM